MVNVRTYSGATGETMGGRLPVRRIIVLSRNLFRGDTSIRNESTGQWLGGTNDKNVMEMKILCLLRICIDRFNEVVILGRNVGVINKAGTLPYGVLA